MEQTEYEQLTGIVSSVIYQNMENGYSVVRLEADDGSEQTAFGVLPMPVPGEELLLEGNWETHPSYGRQFHLQIAERIMPGTESAIYEYLASRAIKGIGPSSASTLVSVFGSKTLDVLENSPERVAMLSGFTMKRASKISEEVKKQMGMRRLMEFLSSNGLRTYLAPRLYRSYGEKASELIHTNPYVICLPHIGGTFLEADTLGHSLEIEPDNPERLEAAIRYEMQYNTNFGHVFIPRDKLIAATAQMIHIESAPVEESLDCLIESGMVVREQIAGCDACYLEELYQAETGITEKLTALAAYRPESDVDTDSLISEIEQKQNLTYAPMQRKILEEAKNSGLLVITGGPGTGKTTAVRAVIALYEKLGLKVQLAAPTGRAAKRMTDLTGMESKTIHRLLECGYSTDDFTPVFRKNASEPLKCDAVILDECSMIDVTLMYALLSALPNPCRLILVGDADQLPSVGPGNFLSDILRSGKMPVVRLTEVFRQNGESRIISFAHMINEGQHPDVHENKGDFFFLKRNSTADTVKLICELCQKRLPDNMHIPAKDIQVLTATRKGEGGTGALNAKLQEYLNPSGKYKPEKAFGNVIFRLGDRVMQVRNNYDIIWNSKDGREAGTGIFNGDVGYITNINTTAETLTVDYDGHCAEYAFEMLSELEHAWAVTVHKSQGSEYPAVILCLSGTPAQLAYRSILYTAVTRAKKILIVAGNESIFHGMIDHNKQTRRYSGLRARLVQQ